MEQPTLFKVFGYNKHTQTYDKELHVIKGYTTQKLDKGKPVDIGKLSSKYRIIAEDVLTEKKWNMDKMNNYHVKNNYFQNGNIDQWEHEVKELNTAYNWELRVLLEQSQTEEASHILIDFAKKAQEEYCRNPKILSNSGVSKTKKTKTTEPPRRFSQRIKDKHIAQARR